MAGIKCPQCAFMCKPYDNFCQQCGTALRDRSDFRPPRRRREEPETLLPGPVMWFLDTFPGLMHPTVILFTLLAVVLSAVGIYMAVFYLELGALIFVFFIGGAAVLLYWAAMCWLLSGSLCTPVEAMTEFTGKHWLAFILLTAIPASMFMLFTKILAGQQ